MRLLFAVHHLQHPYVVCIDYIESRECYSIDAAVTYINLLVRDKFESDGDLTPFHV